MGLFRGATVGATITAKTDRQYSRAFRDARREATTWSRQVERDAARAKRAFKAVAIGLGIGAIAAGGTFLRVGIDELKEAQPVAARTAAVLKSTGRVAGVTAREIDKLAAAQMRKSGVDDELIKSGANMLLNFQKVRNGAEGQRQTFTRATKAALDLAQATGKDLVAANQIVGRALQAPEKASRSLRAANIILSDSQQDVLEKWVEQGKLGKAQEFILRQLEKRYKGTAEAMGQTATGKAARAREVFRNLAADITGRLLPGMNQMLDKSVQWVASVDKWSRTEEGTRQIRTLRDGISSLVQVAGSALRVLGQMAGFLVDHRKAVVAAAAAIAGFVIVQKSLAVMSTVNAAINTAIVLWKAYRAGTYGATIAQLGLNKAIMANPVGLIAGLVAGAAAAFIAYRSQNDQAAKSADANAAANRRLTASIRGATEANLLARNSSFAYIDAVKQEKQAAAAADAARQKFGKNSKQFAQAEYEAARATALREEAETALGTAMKDRGSKAGQLRKDVEKDRAAYDKAAGRVVSLKQAIIDYAAAQKLPSMAASRAKREIHQTLTAQHGVEIDSLEDLHSVLAAEVKARNDARRRITDGQDKLRDATHRSGRDINLILKNTGKVKPEFRQYHKGVVDELHEAGLLTDREVAAVRKRMRKSLDDVKPDARNLGANFTSVLRNVFGNLTLPTISIPLLGKISGKTSVGRQRGGMIPGYGAGDKVHVMAEPGEGFINRTAVRALGGPSAIDAINRAFPRFQNGGVVGRLLHQANLRAHPTIPYLRSQEAGMLKRLRALVRAEPRLQRSIGRLNRQVGSSKGDTRERLRQRLEQQRQALRDNRDTQRTLADEIVSIRDQIAQLREEQAQGVPGGGVTLADLLAQLQTLAASMQAAFQSESGNVFGRLAPISITNNYAQAPTANAWAMQQQHALNMVGG